MAGKPKRPSLRRTLFWGGCAIVVPLGIALATYVYAERTVLIRLEEIIAKLDRTDPHWRLDDLEKLCASYEGVEKAFAIQAGREVRVLVENSRVNDDQAALLSKDIARRIEDSMTYAGQVRVCVIRETRSTDYAK